ncbi:xanthine dehydrogenase small subunit [Paraglaciecola aquimarina]|uniref:Xanthine dehydrogenase small subunit n=1 Tax=Paraglaciecola aquimarina TaxID=1235557 RepID=A0ABU3SYH1_9ALTE|nr:xanthine dehydrogenase small subunit [Paraglaciecola aquimarina]MDU0355053.1 xanthine dehydrogenase small subunit [Paraglaciecola aquimarina]
MLNDTTVKLETVSPQLNVLQWLRNQESLTGTKEGCGTGDCGACTLLVGEVKQGQWHYKTMNSCLMLLGNAHGKHIITVEFLTQTKHPELSDLHPVQRALVECHGSQCGFCTPGFVMSLLALYINNDSYPGKKAVIHALGGNLCRCTGYQPILNAAEKCFDYPRVEEPWSEMALQFEKVLTSIDAIPSLRQNDESFFVPQNLEDLLNLKNTYPTAKLVAGSTDLSIEIGQQFLHPEQIISVLQVPELSQLIETEQTFEIGAAVAYDNFIQRFCAEYPESKELFERLGSCQIRNTGTLGGSIGNASPIGDPAPLLIALNAKIEIANLNEHRVIDLQDFFVSYKKTVLQPNEVITKIIVPKRSEQQKLACHKISKRIEDDISAVCLAVNVTLKENRIISARCALGGMAAIPARATALEQALIGKFCVTQSFIEAANTIETDFTPMTDVRASAEYRLDSAKNLVTRIGTEFSTPSDDTVPVRIYHAAL